MKRFYLLLTMVVAVVALSGCAVSSNPTKNINLVQTNVVLQEDNFRIVKNVSAEVTETYVFGIGGLSRAAARENAVALLTESANLSGSQALINVTVKSNTKVVLFWSRITYTAYGTVIEFE